MSSLNDYNAAVAAGTTVGHEYARQQQQAELCEHCQQPKHYHPIYVAGSRKFFVCALDYATHDPQQLPFDLRPLSQSDRDELQEYFNK